jgi:hypothetical protein
MEVDRIGATLLSPEGESHGYMFKSPMKRLLIRYAFNITTQRQFSHCIM